jgi:hypothetical protein
LQVLAGNEAIERLSRDRDWHWVVWFMAIWIRLVAAPIAEEFFKRSGHTFPYAPRDKPTVFEWVNVNWLYVPWFDWVNWFDLLPVVMLCFLEVFWNRTCTSKLACFAELIVRVFVHFTLSQWPMMLAVVLHCSWNTMVLMSHIHINTSRLWMLDVFNGDDSACMVRTDVCLDEYAMKEHPVQDEFRVRRADPVCKPKLAIFGSWGIKGYVGTVFRSCTHNEVLSMNGRVGKKLPAHSSPKETARIRGNWKRLTRTILPLFDQYIRRIFRPIDFEEWAASFEPARRDALLQVRKEVNDMPFKKTRSGQGLMASSFIKKEVAVKSLDNQVFKDPRFIQGCPLELSCACGPYLRPWTKHVRNGLRPKEFVPSEIRRGLQVSYTCGMTNQEIGAEFGRALTLVEAEMAVGDQLVVLEDDQSRFDLHLLEGPFRFLQALYRKKLPRRVAFLLRRKLSQGVSNLGTKYSIPYTMQSGWPDTSVADTLVNAAMKHDIHGTGRLWYSIICGDDSVTVTTRRELERCGGVGGIVKSYADFGMEVEATVRDNPLDVEFCSGRFFPANGSYVLMPKPGRLLSKICWDMKERTPTNRAAWLRGIASTLINYGRVDPCCANLGVNIQDKLGSGKVIAERDHEYKAQLKGEVTVTPMDVLVYYDHHYSMCERNVAELGSYLRGTRLGELAAQAHLEQMACVDNA